MSAATLTFASLLGSPDPLYAAAERDGQSLDCKTHGEVICAVVRWREDREQLRDCLPDPEEDGPDGARGRARDLRLLRELLDDFDAETVAELAPIVRAVFVRCLQIGRRPGAALGRWK